MSILVALLAAWALKRRRQEGWSRRVRFALWALLLLAVQVILGAITVWLELPPTTIVLHLGTAMALLALLVLSGLGAADETRGEIGAARSSVRLASGIAVLGAVVVMLGGLVANLGAAPACQGFPLCNGSLLPGGHWRIQLHWAHRLAAYVLVLGIAALPWVGKRKSRGTALLALGLALAQLFVAAAMILEMLPERWRVAHVALGTAVFASLVAHAYCLRRAESPAQA